jgi:fumarylacetoacetate (FAA) hydrolase
MLSLLRGGETEEESSSLDMAAEIVAAVLSLLGSEGDESGTQQAMQGNGSQNQGTTGNLSLGGVEMLLPLEQVRLLAPLPRPASLRMFEVVEYNPYGQGAQGLPHASHELPAFTFGNHGAVYGPDADVSLPQHSEMLYYELEVGCIIGRTGRDIAPEEASGYIAGYTIVNDWVAYDIRSEEMTQRLGASKSRDFATSLGPWLVTPDEVEIYADDDGRLSLTLIARVNQIERSRDNLGKLRHTFPALIAHASRDVTLYPGDVLCSGGLIGYNMPLERGDMVELDVTGLGVLQNRIV